LPCFFILIVSESFYKKNIYFNRRSDLLHEAGGQLDYPCIGRLHHELKLGHVKPAAGPDKAA